MVRNPRKTQHRVHHKKRKQKNHFNKASVGELKVAEILRGLKVKFETEKTFKWLKSDKNYNLRLDFFIPKFNSAIEFDGIYHYSKASKRQLVNDARKNKLCEQYNLTLLRIPYWEFDSMEEIIKKFLYFD